MRWASLRRARCLGGSRRDQTTLYALGILSALLAPLLILDLGLIVQLLSDQALAQAPQDRLLGPLARGWWGEWSDAAPRGAWSGGVRDDGYYVSLLLLIGLGFVGALMRTGLLVLFHRAIHGAALRAGAALRIAIHAQAFQLDALDLLGPGPSRAETLLSYQTKSVEHGLVGYWRAAAHDALALAALVLMALAVNFWLALLAILVAGLIWRRWDSCQHGRLAPAGACSDEAQRSEAALLERVRLAALTGSRRAEHSLREAFDNDVARHRQAVFRDRAAEAAVVHLLVLSLLLGGGFLLLTVGMSNTGVANSILLAASLLTASFPAARLLGLHRELDEADKAAANLFAYFDLQPTIRQVEGASPLPRLRLAVELENVTLIDSLGHKLLDGVSLSIPAGKRTAIVSSDGRGPLALAGLLARFFDPQTGRVLFDGRDIRNATLDTVRAQTALVAAGGMLFTDSVEENVRRGDSSIAPLRVAEAVKRVQAESMVERLPQGLATIIGPGGLALPADVVFRLVLARALLRDPSLLVVEEAPAEPGRDAAAETDGAVEEAVAGRTVIAFPARLSTLRSADNVCVFREGRLAAQGSHSELLQRSELYRHLNYIRFNAFRDVV